MDNQRELWPLFRRHLKKRSLRLAKAVVKINWHDRRSVRIAAD